jgi:hypothetical protein
MKTTLRFSTCAMLLLVGVAAHAESGSTSATQSATHVGAGAGPVNGNLQSGATVATTPTADPEAEARLQKIRERTAKASRAAVAKAERRLSSTTVKVNSKADAEEDQVAERLAKEFGMTAEAIRDEQQRLETRWGDVMIAHTIQSNATTALTIDQLYQLKGEGNEWSRIAAAMGLSLDELTTAVKSEGRVAVGLEPGDGKVAIVHGTGAKAGIQSSAAAGVDASRSGAGVTASIHSGADAATTLPRVKVRN